MGCKYERMHRSENIKKAAPVCTLNKMYCSKVKFVRKKYKPKELLQFEIVEEVCQLENT